MTGRRDGSGGPSRRTGLGAAVRMVLPGVALALLTVCGCADGGRRQAGAEPPPIPPVVVAADAYGALVLVPSTQEVVGFDAAGTVVWRDHELAGYRYVSCLARCPDAVGSNADAGRARTEPTIWRVGRQQVTEPRGATVLSAESRTELVELRSGPAGGDAMVIAGGRAPLRTPVAGPVQVVTSGSTVTVLGSDRSGRKSTMRIEPEARSSRWTSVRPERTAAAGLCEGAAGAAFDDRAIWSGNLRFGTIRTERTGWCKVGTRLLLAASFSGSSSAARQTTVKAFDVRTGGLVWTLTAPGNASVDLRQNDDLALVSAAGVTKAVDRAGAQVVQRRGADARFVQSTREVVLVESPETVTRIRY